MELDCSVPKKHAWTRKASKESFGGFLGQVRMHISLQACFTVIFIMFSCNDLVSGLSSRLDSHLLAQISTVQVGRRVLF